MSEAGTILAERLKRYRDYPYENLVRLIGSPEVEDVPGSAGKRYQLEFEVSWDAGPGGNVRVMGSIDGGGIRAIFPVTDDFIKAPDGSFVGE